MKTLKLDKVICPRQLKTPDNARGAVFTIKSCSRDVVTIITKNGTSIEIPISAFDAAIRYLQRNKHYKANPCKIIARNSLATAGPLCKATRQHAKNIRSIDYILPILAFLGIVETCGRRPNTTWLL
jgi:hypothetical protein